MCMCVCVIDKLDKNGWDGSTIITTHVKSCGHKSSATTALVYVNRNYDKCAIQK